MGGTRGKRTWIAVAVVAVLAVAGAAVLRWRQGRLAEARADEARFGVARADVAAPPATVQLSDGRPFVLGRSTGEVVFLNFWATWCPPCAAEMPSMLQLGQDLARRHPNKFRMVAVSVDDAWPEIWQFFGGKLPPSAIWALDTDLVATRAYYCAARGGCPDSFKFPETYVLDGKGRIVAYIVGPRDWSDPAARRFLERLIEG
jgi:thiol-disulfide isomerase/thioredoxin